MKTLWWKDENLVITENENLAETENENLVIKKRFWTRLGDNKTSKGEGIWKKNENLVIEKWKP